MTRYRSRKEAIIDLQRRGYNDDFILVHDLIIWVQKEEVLSLDRLEIEEAHRFKGKSNEGDNHLILAISSIDADLKGILMMQSSPLEIETYPIFFSNL